MRTFNFFWLLFLIWINIRYVRTDCSDLDKNVFIRHPTSGLVVESFFRLANATNVQNEVPISLNTLRAQNDPIRGTDQSWRFRPSKTIGLFNIINLHNSSLLALDRTGFFDEENQMFYATLRILTDDITQQWFINVDGTISNAGALGHVLKVSSDNLLTVAHEAGDSNEVFTLEF